MDPAKVTVHVEVVPSITKAIENVPITIIGQNENYTTKVAQPGSATLNITVEGAPAIIDQLKVGDIQAILDVSNLPPGKHEVTGYSESTNLREARGTQEMKAIVEISDKNVKATNP